jgi:hypothetical protein
MFFLSSVQYRRIWEKLYLCADVGGDSVRRRHGTSMKAQGKKERLQPFPRGLVGAEPRSGKCYPGYRPPVKSVMVHSCALHPTFRSHFLRSLSAKNTLLSRACGQGRVRDNSVFSWGSVSANL